MVGIVMPRRPYVGMHKIGDFKKADIHDICRATLGVCPTFSVKSSINSLFRNSHQGEKNIWCIYNCICCVI